MTQIKRLYIPKNGNIQNKPWISAFLELCCCLYSSYNSLDSSENLQSPEKYHEKVLIRMENVLKLSPHKINTPELIDSNAFRLQVILEKCKH